MLNGLISPCLVVLVIYIPVLLAVTLVALNGLLRATLQS
jgi:hypothetical protein